MQAPNLELVAQHASVQLNADYIRPLGNGAFKSAHLVEIASVPYALKVAALGPNSQARIERECDAQRGCAHPAIAKLHQAFAFPDEGANYWVWIEEFLSGGTLQDRRGGDLLGPDVVRAIAIDMIGALDHLKIRSLVHRDIKPANIIFRTESTPVLTDFGIVRALDLPTLTQYFLMAGPGTPAYAAPEQLNNDIALIDWRTDQFGLAVVLAECLLGHHPFAPDGDIHHAIALVASHAAVVSFRELAAPGASDRITSILTRSQLERVYLIFYDDLTARQQWTDTEALVGSMMLIRSLERAGTKVLVGYCGLDMMLWKYAGASDVATGKFFNLRRFGPERWDESETEGRVVEYWTEPGLITWLRENDVTLLLRRNPELITTDRNPFSPEILAALAANPRLPWRALSWRQYLWWFSNLEADLSQQADVAVDMLRRADANWAAVEASRLLLFDRTNDGSWIRPWLNGISGL